MTDCRPNGDGLVAFGFITHLAERGHLLHVAVQRSEISGRLPSNVVLHHLGNSGGATARVVFMYRMRRLFDHLHSQERFDLAHQLNPVFAGLSLALAGTPVPLVLGTYIADWPTARAHSVAAGIARYVGRAAKRGITALQQHHADALLLTTPAAHERIAKASSMADRIFMLPNGIDVEHFKPSERAADNLTIVSLCGLSARKGAHVLLDAFALVARAVPNATLKIGGGVSKSEVSAAQARLGTNENVTFTGPIPRDELPAFLGSGSVFCMPSFGEPYGMAALEAMACGLPVVASNSGGLSYLVPDDGGRKVTEGSPGAFATALTDLLNDRQLRWDCGTLNRSVVLQNFSWPTVIDRLESIYAAVVTRTRMHNSLGSVCY